MIKGANKQMYKKGQIKPGQVLNPKGRPKGSKNKFTLFKQEVIDLWEEEGGKEKLRELFKDNKNFFKVLDRMIAVCPKEPLIKQEEHTHITYVWKGDNESSRDSLRASELPEGSSQ